MTTNQRKARQQMSDDIVVVRTCANDLEAHLDASVLEANGIPVHVNANTAGGAYPGMVLLLVRAEDAALALELLDAPADPLEYDEDKPPSA